MKKLLIFISFVILLGHNAVQAQEAKTADKDLVLEGESWNGSVMFSDEGLERIGRALQGYRAQLPGVEGGDFTNTVAVPEESEDGEVRFSARMQTRLRGQEEDSATEDGGKKAAKKKSAEKVSIKQSGKVSFFFNSLLYRGPDDWTMWLNKTRIRVAQDVEHIKVQHVREDDATMVWVSIKTTFDIMSPGYKNKMERTDVPLDAGGVECLEKDDIPEDETEEERAEREARERARKTRAFESGNYHWHYVSKDGRLAVDSCNDIALFKLRPYETFHPAKMEIADISQK